VATSEFTSYLHRFSIQPDIQPDKLAKLTLCHNMLRGGFSKIEFCAGK